MGGIKQASAFTWRVVLPVALAIGITVATVAGFVVWSTAKSDDRARERETHIAGRVIAQTVEQLAAHQDYNSNWDEAITALKEKDVAWLDTELASALYQDGAFDRIYVLTHAAEPLYAMYEGGKTGAERFEADRATVAPMVEKLKSVGAAGALAAYDAGNRETVPNVTEIALIDGRPAFVGVSAIMSESGEEPYVIEPGEESFLICIRFLEGALAKDFSDQFFIADPVFAASASTDADRANLALTDAAGSTVGWFTWTPERPGAVILSQTVPAMGGALAIEALVLVLLLRSLRRTTSQLEAGRAEAEFRANHDVLTGLANRAHFNRQLDEAITQPSRDGAGFALLALDLDRFKQVNDTLGHEAGDQLLCEVGRRLKAMVSQADTIARLGGDEFAIIQRGVTSPEQVSALSSRIIGEIGSPFVVTGKVAEIGVSIGIVVAPAVPGPRDIASKADIALYAAKNAGRNTFRIFDDALQAAASSRDALVAELKDARLPGAEALATKAA